MVLVRGGRRGGGGGCLVLILNRYVPRAPPPPPPPRSLELMFTGYVPLASQSPYSIIVYFWPIIEPILVIYAPTLSMWFQAAERNAVNAILLLN